MTTVISRLYSDAETANAVVSALREAGFPKGSVDLIAAGGDAAAAMDAARVSAGNAAVYAKHLSGNAALVVTRVGLMPLGAARAAMEMMDEHGPANVGLDNENVYLRERPNPERFIGLSVMTDHRRFLSSDMNPGKVPHQRVTEQFGMRMLSKPRRRSSAISGGGFKSRMFWPMPLLSRHKERNSAMSGTRHMSRAFWPMPLISGRKAG